MGYGILATAFVTCMAGTMFAIAADRVRMHRHRMDRDPGTIFLFFSFLAAMLLVAGVREAAAWRALSEPAWVVADRFLFYVAATLAAYAIVPLAQLVSHIALGPKLAGWVVTYGFSAIATLGVAFLIAGGIDGPRVDAWGSDWHIQSPVVVILVVLFAVIPGLTAMWLLARRARHLPSRDARRVGCVAGACALYVSVLALGTVGVPGALILIERGAYLVAGASAMMAYRAETHAQVHTSGTSASTEQP